MVALLQFINIVIEKSEYLKNLRGYFHGIKSNRIGNGLYGDTTHEYIDDYIKEVALLLINMFPSEDGYLSIESETSDSLAFFLRNYKASPHSLYALASLFLLAEGVNIPIEIKEETVNSGNKILVLKKKGAENVFHINLSMTIQETPKEGKTANWVYQHKTEYIVDFFKRLATTVPSSRLEVPNEFLMPATYEEFLTGNFLNNPKFLIQSYVFEYIDTVEMYKKFVRAVYELLTEHISSKTNENPCIEAEKSIKKIFDSLFIDAKLNEKLKNTQYIKDLRSAECELKNEMLPTPYINNINMPADGDIPEYNRKSNVFYKTSAQIDERSLKPLTYSNQVELNLLCLFFFFTFDPESIKYDISHLPNPSKELKRFFGKYSDPLLPMDYTMNKEWSRVVEDLPCMDISYKLKSRNCIMFSPFNILYVIREVAGSTEAINKAIDLNGKFIVAKKIKKEVKTHLEAAFKSLSRHKNINAACKFNGLYKGKNNLNEISTASARSFCAIYKKTRTSNSPFVRVKLTSKYREDCDMFKYKDFKNKLKNYNSDAKQELQTLQNKYTNPTRHIEYVMKCYADIYLDKLSFLRRRQYTFIDRIKSVLDGKHTYPNSLLLCGNLENLYYKSKIIEMFLIDSEEKIQYKNNPMVLFIGNLIISIPIHDEWIKTTGIFKYIYTEKCKQYYSFIDKNVIVKDSLKCILLAALNRISQ